MQKNHWSILKNMALYCDNMAVAKLCIRGLFATGYEHCYCEVQCEVDDLPS